MDMEARNQGSIYTRSEKIEPGLLVDLHALGLEAVCRQHYQLPIAVTRQVWDIIEDAAKNTEEDAEVILHDILWMSHQYIVKHVNKSTAKFQAIVRGCTTVEPDHWHRATPVYDFVVRIHGGDHMEPVLTIMHDHKYASGQSRFTT